MLKAEPLLLNGPLGSVEAIWHPVEDKKEDCAALLCHPHPLFDGTMQNKVISILAKTFAESGVSSLRFNFRGVGKSEGEYAEGEGETEDAYAMFNWLKEQQGIRKFYIAGFSFGSYVAANLASRLLQSGSSIDLEHLVLIAPPVHKFDYDRLFPLVCDAAVVISGADEVVPPEQVYAFANRYADSINLIEMIDASHFFHGRLVELKTQLTKQLFGKY